MSIKLLEKKILFLILLFLFFSLLSSCIRQILVNFNTTNQVAKRQKELAQLEEKNEALRVRLEEVQSREFLDEQARKLLGVGDVSASARPPEKSQSVPQKPQEERKLANWQKWFRLFFREHL
ncbi:MAG TPA: septum formation initiator family protein [Clostridia bacterium]|nr:septum formation initiator family protein [Clostridia bacterium]